MKHELTITDYASLVTLHKTIIAAKFHTTEVSPELLGSPLLATIAHHIVELLSIHETAHNSRDASAGDWETWRIIDETRSEWHIATNYIMSHRPRWRTWTEHKKRSFVQIVISPYTLSPDSLDVFINTIDQIEEP